MTETIHNFQDLFWYLRSKGLLKQDMSLVHDPEWDHVNIKDPRAFAYTLPDELTVFTTAHIEALPTENRLGVLLHEIAHILAQTFGGDRDEEVDTDLWILKHVSEAGYSYDPRVMYVRNGKPVYAVNLQTVSRSFVRRIYRGV